LVLAAKERGKRKEKEKKKEGLGRMRRRRIFKYLFVSILTKLTPFESDWSLID